MTITDTAPLGGAGPAEPTTVHLSGELDLVTCPALHDELRGVLRSSTHLLVLDLSGVTYLDSTGLRLIYRLARQLGDRQPRLRLVVPPTSRILRVLTLAGVQSVARVVPDLAHLSPVTEESP